MVMAPAGTPKDVVAKLNAAIKAFAEAPEVQKQMAGMGMMHVVSPSPAELEVFLKQEIERWSKIVQQAAIAGSQ